MQFGYSHVSNITTELQIYCHDQNTKKYKATGNKMLRHAQPDTTTDVNFILKTPHFFYVS